MYGLRIFNVGCWLLKFGTSICSSFCYLRYTYCKFYAGLLELMGGKATTRKLGTFEGKMNKFIRMWL